MDSDPEEETRYKLDNEDDPADSGEESVVDDEGHVSDSGNKSGKLEGRPAAGELKKEISETVENLEEQKQAQTTQKCSKKLKRAVHVDSTDLKFEVHYVLHNEPHILLSQIAMKTLKSVFVSGSHNRNIGECKVVWQEKKHDPPSEKEGGAEKKDDPPSIVRTAEKKDDPPSKLRTAEKKDDPPSKLRTAEKKDDPPSEKEGGAEKKDDPPSEKKGEKDGGAEKKDDPPSKLRTAGGDFEVFWALQDRLEIQKVKSNDIHAILKTYGVEAARATIIHEVNAVFEPFGIDVNMRHLTLVADFMTSGGSYRPMSILRMAQFCTSPFGKMSFEQATRFISEAACYGEVETLDGPSASVSLGKPAKTGTGCSGLLQNMCFVEPPKM